MSTVNETLELSWNEQGLLPAVAQDAASGRVLMLAFLNRQALGETLATGEVHFWSRSRRELWRKGASSGSLFRVVEILADCDRDAVLLKVDPAGPACHTGKESCFFTPLAAAGEARPAAASLGSVLEELAAVIRERSVNRPAGSYTAQLLAKGLDAILKKVGEEAAEVVIASKNEDAQEIVRESADLLYHLLVLWQQAGVPLAALAQELDRRRG
jgi:phosphoribosyl-ATP pyrophosphohydrolase/phosphoribosyl-AMP cyclohydrolase